MTNPLAEPTAAATTSVPVAHSLFCLRTLVCAGLALVAGIWLSGQWEQRRVRSFPGKLQARVITISAQHPARLTEIQARTGQRVSAGTPLLVLERIAPKDREPQHQTQETRRAQAAAELELHWRRKELQAEVFQTQLRLATLRQEKLHLEVEQLAWREQWSVKTVFAAADQSEHLFRFLDAGEPGLSESRVKALLKEDAAESAAQAISAQIELCEQRLAELHALDQKLEAQIRLTHGLDSTTEPRELADDGEEAPQDSTLRVESPGYGLIGVYRRQAGDLVEAGDTLVQILDDDRRSIDVEIPSWAAVSFVAGQAVQLEFPGSERRLGIVASIPPQTMASSIRADGDAPVKLTIEPAGKLWPPAPIGSRVLVYQP